jgi:serine/threonine protein kinase
MAPEIWREEPTDGYSADVWSLGVMLYIMLTGSPLYTEPQDAYFSLLAQVSTPSF